MMNIEIQDEHGRTYHPITNAGAVIHADGSTNEENVAGIWNRLNEKADLNSPAFTGIPTAPTADQSVDGAQIATTAYVKRVLEEKTDAAQYGTWTPQLSAGANTPTQTGSGTWRILGKTARLRGQITLTENNMTGAYANIAAPFPLASGGVAPMGTARISHVNIANEATQVVCGQHSTTALSIYKCAPVDGKLSQRLIGTEYTYRSVIYFDIEVDLP